MDLEQYASRSLPARNFVLLSLESVYWPAEDASEAKEGVSIGRRTLQVTFTCNKCGEPRSLDRLTR